MDRPTAPVALFAFRRPKHLAETLEALARNSLAPETKIVAFVDAPNNHADVPLVDEVCSVLAEFSSQDYFPSLEVHRATAPKGLAQSVIDGLTHLFREHDRVIGLEDDILLHPDGLNFLNSALDAYALDRRVWSVSAYTPPLAFPSGFASDVYFTRRASSWGYATWRDRWNAMRWDRGYFEQLAAAPRFRRRLALGGHDLPSMLDKQLNGQIDSWAVRWCARQADLKSVTVYPVHSLVTNIGLDGTGTHSPMSRIASPNQAPLVRHRWIFGEPMLDDRVSREFRKTFVSRTRLIASRIWRMRHLVRRGAALGS